MSNDTIRDKIQQLRLEPTTETIRELSDIALALLERVQNLESASYGSSLDERIRRLEGIVVRIGRERE